MSTRAWSEVLAGFTIGVLLIVAAVVVTSCALFQSAAESDLVRAGQVGSATGAFTCLVASQQAKPAEFDVALKVVVNLQSVLATDNVQTAAVLAAVHALPAGKTKAGTLVAVQAALALLPANAPTVPKDSPAFRGLSSFVSTCERVLSASAPPE